MKKSLLLAAAALMTATAVNAQPVVAKTQSNVSAAVSAIQPFQNHIEFAAMATSAQRKANVKRRADATLKAWYNRPAGSFYMSFTATGGALYSPFVFNPYRKDVTYVNASTGATSYSWSWEQYDATEGVDSFTTRTSTATDLTINTSVRESAYAPALTAINGSASDVYKMTDHVYDSKTTTTKDYDGWVVYNPDPVATIADLLKKSNTVAYLSPKWFCAGTRQGNVEYGAAAYRGAQDADGGNTGKWFGRNWGGWNAMALYVEQPAHRYALRGLQVYYSSYQGTGPATLTARVYKASKIKSQTQSMDSLVFGDLIGTATATLDTTMAESGMLPFTFQEVEGGLPYDVTLDINDPIAIVLSGYDNDNITSWTMFISTDQYDEGYGQHGYMLRMANDSVTYVRGLDNFFTTSLGVTAPTIFMDVEYPILDFWYVNSKTGEPIGKDVTFATTGGKQDVEFWSNHSSDEWSVTDNNYNELPSWLTYTLSDSTANDEYADHSHLVLTAAALPDGVTGRKATVKISYPGAEQTINVTQGTVALEGDINGDGVVNVTDATALVNKVLGTATYDDTLCDLNGDGVVNVTDVTYLVNIILGASAK